MNRWEYINNLINTYKYNSYLEIGCDNNLCFNNVVCANKEGVDPLRGGTVKCTSDQFFTFNRQKFDIIFIDGLHHKEQVLRDVNNSLMYLNSGGIILIHDCTPPAESYQLVPLNAARNHPEFNGGWTGDVWKAAIELRGRDDVDYVSIEDGPGMGFILPRPNTSKLVVDQNLLNWDYYKSNKTELLRIVSYPQFLAWLG